MLICGKGLCEGLVGYQLKKKMNVPYVVCTYGMEIRTWTTTPRTKRQLRKVLQHADLITYINDVTKAELIELGADESKLLEVLPGISERHFNDVSQPLVESTARQYGIKGPYVLSVGRLVPRKGFDMLIEAFSNLDQVDHGDHQLVIIGT